jgi:hypothetical protein
MRQGPGKGLANDSDGRYGAPDCVARTSAEVTAGVPSVRRSTGRERIEIIDEPSRESRAGCELPVENIDDGRPAGLGDVDKAERGRKERLSDELEEL